MLHSELIPASLIHDPPQIGASETSQSTVAAL